MFKKFKLGSALQNLSSIRNNLECNDSRVSTTLLPSHLLQFCSSSKRFEELNVNLKTKSNEEYELPVSPSHSYTPYVSELFPLDSHLPRKAKVIICGGGIFGTSLAYHLSKLGWGKDTLLIEQGRIGGATSWRGSGFLGGVKFTYHEMKVLTYSMQLAQSLDQEGYDVGWKKCGSLHLARTLQRMIHFRRMKAVAEARGTECYMLNPNEVASKCSILNTDDLEGALWVPNDGVCDLYKLCITLIKLARDEGIQIVENCAVSKIRTADNKVVGIDTSIGSVDCDVFVNAAGTWARKIGRMSEPYANVPIHPAEHYFLYTQQFEDIDPLMPAVRDPDGSIYLREHNGGIMAGSFEKRAKPAFERGNLPEKWHLRELGPDWDQFHPALEEIVHRAPILQSVILNELHNSADSFSPDCKWVVGKVPEFKNYFVAAGMKSGGSNATTGVGRMVAEWILDDHPPMDTYEVDILRFLPAHNNSRYLKDRVVEVPGFHYNIEFPFADFKTGRCVRNAAIFPKLKAAGAIFRQVLGYERPTYYNKDNVSENSDDDNIPFRAAFTTSWTKPSSFDYTASEYWACREASGLLDYSSYAKFDIWSREGEVLDGLQYLCSNNVDIPVGAICHTGMQNKYGGYENDCSLARVAENHYMMIAPSVLQMRCMTWLKLNLPADGSVVVSDETSMYTALCVMGPKSRDILSELSDCDFSSKGFPFFTFKEINVGLARGIRAMNLTHTGELGWVLYIPNEYALHVYDNLISTGKKHGMIHAGYNAMRSLRVEKFFAFWGQDLDLTATPLECGRVFRTKLDKAIDFIGRSALEKQQKEGVKKLFVHLTLEDHDHEIDDWPCGREPIYRDGKFVGFTTTTAFGYTLQKMVCLGFIHNINSSGDHDIVTPEYVIEGHYEVDIAGTKFNAKASLRSPNLPSKYPDAQKDNRYVATRI